MTGVTTKVSAQNVASKKCYNCNKFGSHISAECTYKKPNSKNESKNRKSTNDEKQNSGKSFNKNNKNYKRPNEENKKNEVPQKKFKPNNIKFKPPRNPKFNKSHQYSQNQQKPSNNDPQSKSPFPFVSFNIEKNELLKSNNINGVKPFIFKRIEL